MKALSGGNSYLYEETGRRPDKAVAVSKDVFIAAPAEVCFGTLAKQLEQPEEWDKLIRHVWPVSKERGRVGAMSRALVDFGGQDFHSSAVITRYDHNSAFGWAITGYPEICVNWVLEPKRNGTVVSLTLTWKAPEWVLSRFLCKITLKRRVSSDLDNTLIQLKSVVECSIGMPDNHLTET